MSYTVLARRYRSGTFDEIVGQSQVAQTLKKAIESDRVAHAYLFCGTRGSGKTSTARILAKALNCEKFDKPTTTPCGVCNSCQAIARGDDIDVIEIDAASNTGVDNVRDLIDNSQYRPARSRFKIYIIDEVHMLSKSAFNALLKTLEEPPGHVKFILATTEPEKVPATILSRCQRYDFRNIPTKQIAEHLAAICKQEKIKADSDALLLIAKTGAGSMRDALSLLDRVLSLGEKHVTLEMIEQLLGLPKAQLMFDLAEAIGQADVKSTLRQTQAILMGGLSVDAMLASLVDHLRNLLILRTCGEDDDLIAVPGLSMKDLAAQAQRFEVMNLSQDIAILEELRRQVRQGHGGRALVDATMVRLAMADQFASVVDLLEQVDSGRGLEQKKNGEYRVIESPAARPAIAVSEATDAVAEQEDDALPAVGKVWDEGPKRSLASIMAQTTSPPPVVSMEPVDANDTAAVWRAMLAVLGQKGQAITGLVCQGEFAGFDDDGCAILKYKSRQSGLVRILERKDKRDTLTDAFSRVLGKTVGVRFEISGESEESADKISKAAARPAADPSAERLTAERRAEVEADPLVKAILDSFGGVVLDRSGSI